MYRMCAIGSGHRLTPIVKRLAENDDFEIAAVCDPDPAVKERYEDYPDVRFYTDAKEMLDAERPDCVLIGTRCSLHTHYALLCAKYDIPIFLEKPVCTNYEDYERLKEALPVSDKTVVSFPLRYCKIVDCVRDIINSGKIGEVAHVQAYNNVPYARGYYHGWYRDESETGGLWLQKATHDFDYVGSVIGQRPVRICAMESKQVFKGDMPAGLHCPDCEKRRDCPESDLNVETYGDRYAVQDGCCFAKDTGNHDSGTAIIMYENGVHAVYSQDFIARKGAAKRGARFIGYLGTVEFDFNTGVVQVYYHNENRTERHELEVTRGHSGGDVVLTNNFADVVRGKVKSYATLKEGLLSAQMCLAAKRSSETNEFVEIEKL